MRKPQVEIKELDVGIFFGEGDNYNATRAYLRKYRVVWSEQRGCYGELLSIHLVFPSGATHDAVADTEKRQYSKISLKETVEAKAPGVLYWWINKDSGLNGVIVPYVLL